MDTVGRNKERIEEYIQNQLAQDQIEDQKLKMNVEKSKVVGVVAIRNFKFLGFAIERGKNDISYLPM